MMFKFTRSRVHLRTFFRANALAVFVTVYAMIWTVYMICRP